MSGWVGLGFWVTCSVHGIFALDMVRQASCSELRTGSHNHLPKSSHRRRSWQEGWQSSGAESNFRARAVHRYTALIVSPRATPRPEGLARRFQVCLPKGKKSTFVSFCWECHCENVRPALRPTSRRSQLPALVASLEVLVASLDETLGL